MIDTKKKLTLAKADNSQWDGVCGGLAEYFDIDPTVVRIIFVILAICTGLLTMLIVYFVFALVMPDPDETDSDERIET